MENIYIYTFNEQSRQTMSHKRRDAVPGDIKRKICENVRPPDTTYRCTAPIPQSVRYPDRYSLSKTPCRS